MKKFRLKNGITIVHQPLPSASVVLQVLVKAGSNNETDGIRGMAHFLEHMVFEGTKKRQTSKIIAAEIENVGGEFNAYTTGEYTAFHIKVLRKHFDIALDVMADMLHNSTFMPTILEKEKNVVLKEIHMVLDDPRFYKWILFDQTIFKKHPGRHPTYGTEKDVRAFNQQKLLDFYHHHYQPNNMIVSVVGAVDGVEQKIAKTFSHTAMRKPSLEEFHEPPFTSIRSSSEKRKTQSAYTVLGFLTCARSHPDSYALDILEAIFGRGQSGRMFDEIRAKKGLAYEVGVRNDLGKDAGYMAVFASTDKKKADLAKQLMLREFRKPVSKKEVEDAKTFIEGNYLLQNEITQEHADELCYWEYMGDARLADTYIPSIKKVSYNDVLRVQKKYFSGAYAVAVVGPK